MKVSYCTLCKGRRHQLKSTLRKNLTYIQDQDAEIVLIDWQSKDGLRWWVLETFHEQLNTGKLLLFSLLEDRSFSIPVGKNFAHRLARGKVLFNLDADNFAAGTFPGLSRLGIDEIQGCKQFSKGVFGRIGISRIAFQKLGGYDESFLPAGAHDTDLINRAIAAGMRYANQPAAIAALQNSKEATIAEIGTGGSWKSMERQNRLLSKENISRGQLQANSSGFTPAIFEDHLGILSQLGSSLWPDA